MTIIGIEFTPRAFHTVCYGVIVIAFGVCVLLMWRIVHSPFGQTLQEIRDNETRAVCIGIRVARYRWCAFIISGIFTGLAGGLYGQLDRQVTPEQLHWLFSIKLVLATWGRINTFDEVDEQRIVRFIQACRGIDHRSRRQRSGVAMLLLPQRHSRKE